MRARTEVVGRDIAEGDPVVVPQLGKGGVVAAVVTAAPVPVSSLIRLASWALVVLFVNRGRVAHPTVLQQEPSIGAVRSRARLRSGEGKTPE